ncbi:hypothetical protein BS50DRAFT_641026 [Corynespora cassiicola Philippines]|uniref:HypA-like protein n=1 Tax=Corynespora cassiicola Philippines TaxID=1448308 RepID=A0A2T2N232_CORCC|nr:hypothetical protein BS50DRAFT_641026 [Corynespora cassiicola Philippines]
MTPENRAPVFRPRIVEEKPAAWATPYNIHFDVDKSKGCLHVDDLKKESAEKVSDLLMLNHAKYHTLFNEAGLHNHIAHHLCTLWALGATPSQIQAAYDMNKSYQLPHYHHGASNAIKLRDPVFHKACLGKSEFYIDYLRYYQDEITEKGVAEVVKRAFQEDEAGDDLLARLFNDLQHPIIHLGFGLEFDQPCLVAEAFASASTHDESNLGLFLPAKQHVASNPDMPRVSMLSIIQSLGSNPVFSGSIKPTDPPDRIRGVLIPRLGAKLALYLSRWRVEPTEADIEYRTAEMINVSTYLLGAAQHPDKQVAMDFVTMHCANLGIFLSTFKKLPWLSLEQKAKVLTWKAWTDMSMYVACGCPTLYPERITNYAPKNPGPWPSVISRAISYPDDGHIAKSARAILHAQNTTAASPSYKGNKDFPMQGKDFLNMAHMLLDSMERTLTSDFEIPEELKHKYGELAGVPDDVLKIVARYVQWCGIEGAWKDVPDLRDGITA